jgi:hypothetical protein
VSEEQSGSRASRRVQVPAARARLRPAAAAAAGLGLEACCRLKVEAGQPVAPACDAEATEG